MARKNNTLIYVGVGLGVLVGGVLIYTMLKRKKDNETYSGGGSTGGRNTGGSTGGGGNTQTTGGQILNTAIETGLAQNLLDTLIGGNKNKNQGNNTIANVPDSPPFESRAEGNAFRGWVNDNYPAYAQSIDLDREGRHDNSYITQAWQKYGHLYPMSFSGYTTNYIG